MNQDKPNNKFKYGDWVVCKEAVFKVDNIRVFGDNFGYSGECIDGWTSESELILADSSLLLHILKHISEINRGRK
jgi:hypothetical protein